jgi:D-alanyl-D-alanine carboxypeptidase
MILTASGGNGQRHRSIIGPSPIRGIVADMTNHAEYEKVQQILDHAVAEQDAVSIVAHVQEANDLWFGAAGPADLATGRFREPEDQFSIGSGGKAFTAATMLALEAEGRLSLTDTVEQWLPGVVTGNGNDGSRITIRQLLTHTSGLGITGVSAGIVRKNHTRAGLAEHRYDVWTVDELLQFQMSIPPIYEPGEDFAYSNGGYHVAGAIIERVTGRSFADEVDRNVIEPLGLSRTYERPLSEPGFRGRHPKVYSRQFIRDDVDPESVTELNYTELLEGPDSDPVDVTDKTSEGWAASGVVSTTSDMLRFTKALITGELLPAAQHRQMWTTVPTRDWMPNARYGTGVSRWELANGRALHAVAGVDLGGAALTMGTPDGARVVSVHISGDWKWYEIVNDLVESVFGAPFAPPR